MALGDTTCIYSNHETTRHCFNLFLLREKESTKNDLFS